MKQNLIEKKLVISVECFLLAKTDSIQPEESLPANLDSRISPQQNTTVPADSLIKLEEYEPRLHELSQQLDSLTRKQKEIDSQLVKLKSNSYLMQKKQQQGDLVNGIILIFFVIVLLRIMLSWWKNKKTKSPL